MAGPSAEPLAQRDALTEKRLISFLFSHPVMPSALEALRPARSSPLPPCILGPIMHASREVPVRRYWWWFRLAFLSLAFVALGLYLFASTPWRKWVGLAPDYHLLVVRGHDAVQAIHQFQSQCGLWPQYLEDLVPGYLDAAFLEPQPPPAARNARWFYDLSPVPDQTAPGGMRLLPSLSIRLPEGSRAHLGYDFDPVDPAWRIFGDTEPQRLPTSSPPPHSSPSPPAHLTHPAGHQVMAAAQAELARRIAREPGEVEHRRRLAGLLMAAGNTEEVRAVIAQAAIDLPESYWPRLASAVLDLAAPHSAPAPAASPTGLQGDAATAPAAGPAEVPAPPESLQAFAQWVQRRPSMTRWFYLSHLERQAQRPHEAAAAMAKAAQMPVEVAADDPHAAAYYLWDMTRWALETRRWPLVSELADAWELAYRERLVADPSFLPLRAAARLSQGNFAGARQDLEAFDALPPPHPPTPRASARLPWAQHIDTPGGLRDAIERHDRTFRYDPGKFPAPFNPFPLPE